MTDEHLTGVGKIARERQRQIVAQVRRAIEFASMTEDIG